MQKARFLATAALGLATSLYGVSAADGAVVFVDNFTNGVPANSDSIASFWSVTAATNSAPGTGSTATTYYDENNTVPGQLYMEVTDANNGTTDAHPLIQLEGQASTNYAFDTTAHTYSFTFSQSPVSTFKTWASQFRFWVSDDTTGTGSSYSASNAVTMQIDAQGTFDLGFKNGAPNSTPLPAGHDFHSTSNGTVTGLDLTLDPVTQSYTVVIHNTAHNGATYTGTYASLGGLTAWHEASFGFYFNESDPSVESSSGAYDLKAAVDQVQVSAVPEPATLGLLTVGGLLILARRRPAA